MAKRTPTTLAKRQREQEQKQRTKQRKQRRDERKSNPREDGDEPVVYCVPFTD